MAEPRVSLVPVPQVDEVWPYLRDGFDRACRKTGGDITAEYLWAECRSGSAFLTVVIDGDRLVGGGIFRFEKWTSGQRLRCIALCGKNMKAWLPQHLEFAKAMARFGGATAIVSDGRRGFERVFRDAKVLRCLFEMPI